MRGRTPLLPFAACCRSPLAACCCWLTFWPTLVGAEGPAGYSVVNGFTLSDPEKCKDAKKDGDSAGRCGNLGGAPRLKEGGAKTCGGSASGYSACVTEAAAACDGDAKCFSFIVPSVGRPGNNWYTYSASVANAAPNVDWDIYWKPPSM